MNELSTDIKTIYENQLHSYVSVRNKGTLKNNKQLGINQKEDVLKLLHQKQQNILVQN